MSQDPPGGRPTDPHAPSASARRRGALRLSDLVASALGDALKRQGFASAEIVTRWPEIVGPRLAGHSRPLRLAWPRARAGAAPPAGAVLHLAVHAPYALEARQSLPVVLERVNAFLGWAAVGAIKLVPMPLEPPVSPSLPAPDPAELQRRVSMMMDDLLADGADPDLRTSLARLGTGVLARSRRGERD